MTASPSEPTEQTKQTEPPRQTDPSEKPVALVTGGGTGIGAATARRLVEDGYAVLVAGRRRDRLDAVTAELGDSVTPVQLDVTDPASVDAAFAGLDRLDVLVNNAGGALGVERVEDGDLAKWEAMYATNVLGTVRVTQAALPLLRRSPRTTIVMITSIAGDTAYEGGGGYVAAKHAEVAVSQTLRLELNGEPVRVIDIHPGMVHTEEFSLTRLDGDQAGADKVYEGVDRPLVADDVAACVAFAVGLPQHVNIDTLVVKPVAQAAPHKLHRGAIDWTATS
ncbi:NADP-dependent 3-hydroxy acid dehydrogenase YdfG [Knoellia remsis]|uniref:NADP-dependent 3-hydroxy acid dehydrogenase YdfG n=1 Tax=Knoellia remsis TaxID=407159 RepID=A0A2T0UJC6_9MICO|nr:SDR family NAD(P)-dependent oxidoreductase [Knoellia remsis]PRY58012.1 NADP-dependent 3-hydroxy acid dehydrogenase YdfG [Knoellia remsis]